MQCIEAAATCLEAGLEAEISHTVDALRNHPGMVLQAYEEAKHTVDDFKLLKESMAYKDVRLLHRKLRVDAGIQV